MSVETRPVASGPSAAVKRVAVVGGGTMGNGIAQVFATSGQRIRATRVDVRAIVVEPRREHTRGRKRQARGPALEVHDDVLGAQLAQVDACDDVAGGDEEDRVLRGDEPREPCLPIGQIDDALDVVRRALEPREVAGRT